MKLKNKTVLITGASRGIGKAIALLFANEGANIIVNYCTSEKEATEIVAQINAMNAKAISIKCDISKENEVKKMVDEITRRFGKIDVLVNNAGKIIRPGDSKVNSETWDQTIDINLKGVWLVTKEVTPHMPAGSTILNIASYVGQLGSQYVLPYGIAKAGVINMTKAYAKELSPNIRVNCISPGNIATDMATSAGEAFLEKTISATPLKRLGKPEELASAALFLVSEDSSFITGINLDVDGGFLLLN